MPSVDMLLNYLQGVDGRSRLPATCLANNVYPQARCLSDVTRRAPCSRAKPVLLIRFRHVFSPPRCPLMLLSLGDSPIETSPCPCACRCAPPLWLQSWLDDSTIETLYFNKPSRSPGSPRGYFNRLPLPSTCNYDSWVAGRGCAFSYADPNTGLNLQVRACSRCLVLTSIYDSLGPASRVLRLVHYVALL